MQSEEKTYIAYSTGRVLRFLMTNAVARQMNYAGHGLKHGISELKLLDNVVKGFKVGWATWIWGTFAGSRGMQSPTEGLVHSTRKPDAKSILQAAENVH